MAIRILSFDFDGCLFNERYRHSIEKDVIAANLPFLESLKKDNHLYKKNISIIGSNRQSKASDDANLSNRGSCFPAIKQVSTFLETEFSPFLLADIYGNLSHGTSYANAINPEFPATDHQNWMFDASKVSVLYAQMHKFAKENPNDEIIFDFFDDKGFKKRDNILEWLKGFYTKYPELIPPKVTLRLNHYHGDKVTPFAVLKANQSSFIDENYEKTVKDMAAIAKAAPQAGNGIDHPLDIGFYVNLELLPNRVPFKEKIPSITTVSLFSNNTKSFPESYTTIWSTIRSQSRIAKTRALLADYTKQDSMWGSLLGRVITGHWNRHHVDEIQQLLQNKYESMDDLLFDLKEIHRKQGGSLDRRIAFIETQIQNTSQQFTL